MRHMSKPVDQLWQNFVFFELPTRMLSKTVYRMPYFLGAWYKDMPI